LSVAAKGKVYLVGAGPGDPDLLTLRAAALLASADVILHDDLVPAAILALAGEGALLTSVGKRCGKKKTTQAEIHDRMISSARRHLAVVRLKSGDPLIFGRAGEEIDALRAAGIPFEIVPGVTAVSSAGAFLETSLTHRRLASKLVIVSGHHAAGEKPEYSPAIFAEDSTVAIYMPGKNLSSLAASLLGMGVAESLPCVAVNDASRPEARYQACRLKGVAGLSMPEGPSLLLLGRAFEPLLARTGEPAAPLPIRIPNRIDVAIDDVLELVDAILTK
jgi:uroporphyrin-III C-methyltransferase